MAELKQKLRNVGKLKHKVSERFFLKPKKFSDKIRTKINKHRYLLKQMFIFASLIGVNTSYALYDSEKPNKSKLCVVDNNNEKRQIDVCDIDNIVSARTLFIQNEILSNVDSLQRLIVQARRTGSKYKVVKKILDDVYPNGHLSGNTHYCVAGMAESRLMCDDATLNDIMPNPSNYPSDDGYTSSPNVSCVYLRKYFKDTLGNNYAQKGDKHFNEVINTVEAGDVIIVRSSRNTSSGEHCVTVAGPINQNGFIPVMSLNTESNYNVHSGQVIGAAKIIEQYRHNLTNSLLQCYESTLNVDQSQPFLAFDGDEASKVNGPINYMRFYQCREI